MQVGLPSSPGADTAHHGVTRPVTPVAPRQAGVDRSRKRVLMTAHTLLTLKYIRRHFDLLRADDRLAFYATQVGDDFSPGVSDALPHLGVPIVAFDEAIRQPWDVVLFATHGGASSFREASSKIHIQHGIGAGKRVNGSDFTYGRQWALWEGKPRYDVMLEASNSTKQRAIRTVPELADRITVVGDLFCDDILAGVERREAFRAQLGIHPGQTAVLFMSTWGPHGLFRARGIELLAAAQRLPPQYTFLVTMHNHLWAGRFDEPSSWPEHLAMLPEDRFAICGPLDDWVPFVVAADLAVVDHGSLGLYYAMTRKPAMAIHVPDHVVTPDAPATQLRARYLALERVTDLEAVIQAALRQHPFQDIEPILRDITSFPGEAAARTRSVLYQQLQIPLPQPAPHLPHLDLG